VCVLRISIQPGHSKPTISDLEQQGKMSRVVSAHFCVEVLKVQLQRCRMRLELA
jgi:hypothetical protein